MKNQKIRSMKVHEQSGYNYKATPTIKDMTQNRLIAAVKARVTHGR